MLAENVIKLATTGFAARIVHSPKKNGLLHVCVDYPEINAVAIRGSYPLLHIDECIDSPGEATVSSTLTLIQGTDKYKSTNVTGSRPSLPHSTGVTD